jgi:glycosyltransferase involved in cell wall biosynthesis
MGSPCHRAQAYLIEAMSLLSDHPEAHLVIVGEGHERPQLEALIHRLHLEESVELKGRVSNEELTRLYAACQVFVLPAIVDPGGDTEMLGMVLPEAMRYRKPVVSTRVGGISDIVTDGETGLLVEEKDPLALAEAIARLLNDPALAARLAAAGYAHVRQHFSGQVVAQRMADVYRQALTGVTGVTG